ncbi:hypothetical protein G4B88_019638 [Cannabis sativa]|uniref:Uncharacterized protein n=1 Tax=Cannabis sativa TaxID=3483 RepID=A0A7J6HRL3_CANSA|nr:hypothetical protein G4B88_019638 [Cannabis sativa]
MHKRGKSHSIRFQLQLRKFIEHLKCIIQFPTFTQGFYQYIKATSINLNTQLWGTHINLMNDIKKPCRHEQIQNQVKGLNSGPTILPGHIEKGLDGFVYPTSHVSINPDDVAEELVR